MKMKKDHFILDRKDNQPKEKVRNEIITILNNYLPESYYRDIFSNQGVT